VTYTAPNFANGSAPALNATTLNALVQELQRLSGLSAPSGGVPVFATSDQSVADANPQYVWLVLAPVDTTAPSVPTGLTATAGDTQVALSWTASTDNVGVTGYRVYRGGTLIASPTGTSYTDTGLTNGTAYSYTVAATDAAGNLSAQSAAASATPVGAPTAPSAPTGLTATAGNTQVSLSWTAPYNGGAAITDYIVQYRTTAGPGTWTTFADGTSTATTATVTGLTNGTGYDFHVAAVNSIGTGAYSSTASATPAVNVTASIVAKASTVATPGTTTTTINMPATVAAGDILTVLASVNDANTYTFTAPTGWTTRLLNANGGTQGFVLTKTATGSEASGTIALTWNVAPDETVIAEAYTLRGISTEVPVATGSGTLAFTAGPAMPALTGLPADTMVLGMGWVHAQATTTSPSGMTQDISTGNTTQTADFAHQYLSSGGAASTGSWTFSGSGNGGSLAVAFS
jgi:cellulose 1,4-beta-cellobiosidase